MPLRCSATAPTRRPGPARATAGPPALLGDDTMTTKPSWVDGRVDTLLAELHDLGMSVSRAAATGRLAGTPTSVAR